MPHAEHLAVLQNMMFEVQDLLVASPATVSRCGMVYVEPSQMGWRPLRDSWMASQLPSALTEAHRTHVRHLPAAYALYAELSLCNVY